MAEAAATGAIGARARRRAGDRAHVHTQRDLPADTEGRGAQRQPHLPGRDGGGGRVLPGGADPAHVLGTSQTFPIEVGIFHRECAYDGFTVTRETDRVVLRISLENSNVWQHDHRHLVYTLMLKDCSCRLSLSYFSV